jgi:uncharacterized protein (TIGR02231 family)
MKKFLLWGFMLPLFTWNASFSQKIVEVPAELRSVTIYLQGAEMELRSAVNVPAGSSELVFTDLPVNVNPSTLQVSANADVTIMSAVFQLNYLNTKKENSDIKVLRDSLELVNGLLKKTQGQRNIVKGQMELLNANRDVSGANTGLSMDQLTKMYEFYATKMNDLHGQQLDLEQKEKKINEQVQRLQNQLNEMNARYNQPTGEARVNVAAAAARNAAFQISFLAYDAGWSPIYDVRSKDTKSNILLNYKASVWQRTGSDWNGVKVKLSTGNPTVSATGPLLTPWYLNFGAQQLNEVVIMQGAKRNNMLMNNDAAAAPAAVDSYIAASSSGAAFTTVTQTQLTAEFDISVPYDIPSDGKSHLVSIQDYNLPASYHYYAVPKLDPDAFLVADISNWEELSLLPGTMNVFFEGSYVGQAFLDPSVTKDTLPVSLGRDQSLVIKREKVKDFSKEKIIGDNKRQSFAYTITVKNTKKEAVAIKILDQYPISQQGKIEVTLDEAGGATSDAATGKLWWNLLVAGGEEKKLQFSVTVKYPKDEIIPGL